MNRPTPEEHLGNQAIHSHSKAWFFNIYLTLLLPICGGRGAKTLAVHPGTKVTVSASTGKLVVIWGPPNITPYHVVVIVLRAFPPIVWMANADKAVLSR